MGKDLRSLDLADRVLVPIARFELHVLWQGRRGRGGSGC